MLKLFSQEQKDELTSSRSGEIRLGEMIKPLSSIGELETVEANFVLIGIKEDIGIRANFGKRGAHESWEYVLGSLLNIQSNPFLSGKELCIAGALEFSDFMEESEKLITSDESDLKRLRELTAGIDVVVSKIISEIKSYGKIPIIIGGGHNNAYGIIKGCSTAMRQKLNVLNIDPHTDFRALEGRHSGNGFSYAKEEGYLGKYAVYGLHESYNGASILEQFQRHQDLHYHTFESDLWRNTQEKDSQFKNCLQWLGEGPFGLEIDLDSINRFPVSALNPSGYSLNDVRQKLATATALKQPDYLHICEASPARATSDTEREMLGKSVSYLITDFIKSYPST